MQTAAKTAEKKGGRPKTKLGFMKQYLKPYRFQLTAGPLSKLIEAVLELLMPLFMARVIDGAALHKDDMQFFIGRGASLLLLVVLGMMFSFTCQYMASVTSQGVGTLLRRDVFKKAQSFSFAQLDRFGSASLANRLNIDINNMQFAVAMLIRLVIRAPFLCIGGSILAFYISPKIAVLMLITIPLAALLLARVMSRSLPLVREAQKGTDKLGRLISDHLSGVRIIRAFNRSEHERQYFGKTNEKVNEHLETAAKISALMNPGTVFVVNIGIVLALYMGGGMVQQGTLKPGEMIALINYFSQVLLAMTVTANLIMSVPRTLASAERLDEVLSEEAELPVLDEEEASETLSDRPLLACRGVTYRYTEEANPVLEDISLSIGHDRFIGLIGATGSGKSSLARLLQRFYDPQEGTVFLDGNDIRTYSREEISRKISYVPQKTQLFTASIRENLCLGLEPEDPNYPDDEMLLQALEAAQALDFVMQRDLGLDAPIERGGRNLSGGQRQRLAIARALLRRPEAVILDDSASALDYKTEASLIKALRSWPEPLTFILISQRVNSIRNADAIYVLHEGRLLASGRHDELLEDCEIYREIVATQNRLEGEEGGTAL